MNEDAFLGRLEEDEQSGVPQMQEISILQPKEDGRYRDDDRFICVKFMEAFQRYYKGEMKPNFSKVSTLWGISIQTLSNWWDKREQIKRSHNINMDNINDMVQSRTTAEYLRLLEAVAKRDFDEMSDQNLIKMMREMTAMYRLNTNQSTQNVSVQKTVRIQTAAPETAESGQLPPGQQQGNGTE